MWQEIAIYIVGLGVAVYLASWVYRNFFRKRKNKSGYGCSSCPNCGGKKELG